MIRISLFILFFIFQSLPLYSAAARRLSPKVALPHNAFNLPINKLKASLEKNINAATQKSASKSGGIFETTPFFGDSMLSLLDELVTQSQLTQKQRTSQNRLLIHTIQTLNSYLDLTQTHLTPYNREALIANSFQRTATFLSEQQRHGLKTFICDCLLAKLKSPQKILNQQMEAFKAPFLEQSRKHAQDLSYISAQPSLSPHDYSDKLARVLDTLASTPLPKNHPNPVTKFHADTQPKITLQKYLKRAVDYSDATEIELIPMLIYIDRYVKLKPEVHVSHLNIHRLIAAAYTISAKMNNDNHFNNKHSAGVFGINLKELNNLELDMLFDLKFNLFVSPETFKVYHDRLIEVTQARKTKKSKRKPPKKRRQNNSRRGSAN